MPTGNTVGVPLNQSSERTSATSSTRNRNVVPVTDPVGTRTAVVAPRAPVRSTVPSGWASDETPAAARSRVGPSTPSTCNDTFVGTEWRPSATIAIVRSSTVTGAG